MPALGPPTLVPTRSHKSTATTAFLPPCCTRRPSPWRDPVSTPRVNPDPGLARLQRRASLGVPAGSSRRLALQLFSLPFEQFARRCRVGAGEGTCWRWRWYHPWCAFRPSWRGSWRGVTQTRRSGPRQPSLPPRSPQLGSLSLTLFTLRMDPGKA